MSAAAVVTATAVDGSASGSGVWLQMQMQQQSAHVALFAAGLCGCRTAISQGLRCGRMLPNGTQLPTEMLRSNSVPYSLSYSQGSYT